MAETQTTEREVAQDERPPQPPAVQICEGCGVAIDPLTLSCGCFHG